MSFRFLFSFVLIISYWQLAAQPILSKERQAELYMQNGDFNTAIALYNELIQDYPKNEVYLLNRGWCQLNASNFTMGADDFFAALRINRNCSRCYIGLAILSMQNGQLEEALEQANLAVKNEDTASFNYFIRAQIFEGKGDDFKAGVDFNFAIEKNPYVADYYYSRGNFLFRMQKYSLAIDDFSSAILLDPKVADYHFQRGYTHYMVRSLNVALLDVRKAVALDSNNSDYWLGKGAIEEAMGNLDEALISYARSAKKNPNNALAFFNRANIYFEKGLLNDACIDYSATVKALGKTKYPREDMLNESVMMIENYCDTNSPAYFYQRGMMALELKQYQEANVVLSRGLMRWPNHPLLNAFNGNALMGMKNYQGAILAYQDALKKTDETPEDVRNSGTLRTNGIVPEVYMRQLYSSVYDGLSKSYLAVKKYDEALLHVDKAIFLAQRIPDAPTLSLKLLKVTILSITNKDVEALALVEDLITNNPEFASAYVLRARLILKQAILKDNKGAKFIYKSAPVSGMYYLDFPKRYNKNKVDNLLINSALSDCRMALALNEGLGEAYFVMGQIKLFAGYQDYCNDFLAAKKLGISEALDLLGNPCKTG